MYRFVKESINNDIKYICMKNIIYNKMIRVHNYVPYFERRTFFNIPGHIEENTWSDNGSNSSNPLTLNEFRAVGLFAIASSSVVSVKPIPIAYMWIFSNLVSSASFIVRLFGVKTKFEKINTGSTHKIERLATLRNKEIVFTPINNKTSMCNTLN